MSIFGNDGERKLLEAKLTDRLINNQRRMFHQKAEETFEGTHFGLQSDEEVAKMQQIADKNLSEAECQTDGGKYFENELEELYKGLEKTQDNEEEDFSVSLPRFTGEKDEEVFEVASGYKDDDFEEYSM